MSSPAQPIHDPEGLQSKSFWVRFAGIFFSPGRVFEDVARRPDWVPPLIVMVILSVAVTETTLAKIGAERIVRISLEQSGQAEHMNPEELQRGIEQGARIMGLSLHVFGVIGQPIFLLLLAGLGMAILYGIFGAEASFKRVFSAVCYAGLVQTLRGVMAVPMIFFGDPEHFNVLDPAPTNPGFFLNPAETSKPLMALASSLDIVSIWFLVLLGIGLSEATGKKVGAMGISLAYGVLWLIWVLGRVGLAFLM